MSDNEAIGELLIQFADGQRALLSKFANDLAVVVERNNELAVAHSRLAAVEAELVRIVEQADEPGRMPVIAHTMIETAARIRRALGE